MFQGLRRHADMKGMRPLFVAVALIGLSSRCVRAQGSDLPDFSAVLAEPCPAVATWVVTEGESIACVDGSGELHGPYFGYYASGPRRSYAEYRGGEVHGWIVLWYESGIVKSAGREVAGKPVGEWRWWNPDGSLRRRQDFSRE
ncbi:MAG: hypothetical protein QNK03_07120 [Myxococcota bacterium]|nr:hypothetical protein [Myxococcota bacterium]